ncbi:RHS repeat domain-containing protein [Shewanella fidelis]|uniref:RHS repeat-associated core domain-containing protein n=1 Tax=Shewanella fidelis TaxID=173509 RepID=A0AAW8NHP6_9GAMM|nr:RHS repeat-associated core domain-containing protein [Shewanella fidelis]MDR8522872.1 hypothetical protein [Shewanella fidelis]MDW4811802.1 hypothetical protein [Shewanella fidelis]MDW4815923.1 hypothetical protein [Shewanella fidelis]MDW4820013.1 hypothetical protein [Shewanella fidelis]MDW4824013.1 hypothetical protein [Shewanella fidelis]
MPSSWLKYTDGLNTQTAIVSGTLIDGNTGAVLQHRGYDVFGRPRNIAAGNGLLTNCQGVTKGYTNHEHLNEQQLIHMNGRVYDYNVGRFLSVDPFLQFPENSQSANPYSYILNNPMSGTDPTGYCQADDNMSDCSDGLKNGEIKDVTNADGEKIGTVGKDKEGNTYVTSGDKNDVKGAMAVVNNPGRFKYKWVGKQDNGTNQSGGSWFSNFVSSFAGASDTGVGRQINGLGVDYLNGDISKDEYMSGLDAIGKGGLTGALIVAPGPEDAALAVFVATKTGQWATKLATEASTMIRVAWNSRKLGIGNVDNFIASQQKRLFSKLGAKIGQGRLPYEASKEGIMSAIDTVKSTLGSPSHMTNIIPSSQVRGSHDLIHVYSKQSNSTVSLRVLGRGKYEFDTLISGKSSKF